MNQEIQPLFEVDAIKVAVGSTPDPEVAALPKRRIVREANACKVPGEIGRYCAGKGCTARTSRTGAGRWRPVKTQRSPRSRAASRRISPRPSRAGSRRWSAR